MLKKQETGMINMESVFQKMEDVLLKFINAYPYKTDMSRIWNSVITDINIYYKPDYFKEDNEYYKKGIGDIIVKFDCGAQIVIKHTISNTWCFAVLNCPYNVVEEVWHISDLQKKILPELIVALEEGFPYRNDYNNLLIH
jgi:hypothetical protein